MISKKTNTTLVSLSVGKVNYIISGGCPRRRNESQSVPEKTFTTLSNLGKGGTEFTHENLKPLQLDTLPLFSLIRYWTDSLHSKRILLYTMVVPSSKVLPPLPLPHFLLSEIAMW